MFDKKRGLYLLYIYSNPKEDFNIFKPLRDEEGNQVSVASFYDNEVVNLYDKTIINLESSPIMAELYGERRGGPEMTEEEVLREMEGDDDEPEEEFGEFEGTTQEF